MSSPTTTVHLLRHGEVHNPTKVLYGRLPEFHLSELGHQMAQMVADHLATRDIGLVVASPLERAQETAAPIAASHDLPILTDSRLIEAGNHFEGVRFGHGKGSLWRPANWWLVRNPVQPSWGEPYERIAERMRAAIYDARRHAPGREIVLVSHQLPVWTARCSFEGRRLWHDPRERQCTLASLTTLTFTGHHLTALSYTEPAASLLPQAQATVGA